MLSLSRFTINDFLFIPHKQIKCEMCSLDTFATALVSMDPALTPYQGAALCDFFEHVAFRTVKQQPVDRKITPLVFHCMFFILYNPHQIRLKYILSATLSDFVTTACAGD